MTFLASDITAMRTDRSENEEGQWSRLQPYLYLGAGVVMLVSGWFLLDFTLVPAVIDILAGAVFAGVGAARMVRRRRLQRGPSE